MDDIAPETRIRFDNEAEWGMPRSRPIWTIISSLLVGAITNPVTQRRDGNDTL
jgi:hypothetical protein